MVGILRVQGKKGWAVPEIGFQGRWLDPLFMWVSHLLEDQVLLTLTPGGCDASLCLVPCCNLLPSPSLSPISPAPTSPTSFIPTSPTSHSSFPSSQIIPNAPPYSHSAPHSFIYSSIHSIFFSTYNRMASMQGPEATTTNKTRPLLLEETDK